MTVSATRVWVWCFRFTVNDISKSFTNDVIVDEQLLIPTTQVISSQWDKVGVLDDRQSQDSLQKLRFISGDVIFKQAERQHVLAGQPSSVVFAMARLLQQLRRQVETCHSH
jgi:hypothetical protein